MGSKNKKTTDEILFDLMRELSLRKGVGGHQYKVLILSTPRSGSSMFCDILTNTQKFGEPREWFNMRYINAYARVNNITKIEFPKYVDFIFKKTSSKNGVFSVNLHIEQYIHLKNINFDLLSLGFDKVYYLSRNNKLAQAVSLAKAQLTDQWSSDTKAKSSAEPVISKTNIARALVHIIESDEFYQDNLAKVTKTTFSYEDFSQGDTHTAQRAMFDDLGLPSAGVKFSTQVKKQRNVKSDTKLNEFIDYLCI